jgi:hypothetical protein
VGEGIEMPPVRLFDCVSSRDLEIKNKSEFEERMKSQMDD